MQWRIVLALAGLAPSVVLALRDGKLTREESDQLVDLLVDALAGVLRP